MLSVFPWYGARGLPYESEGRCLSQIFSGPLEGSTTYMALWGSNGGTNYHVMYLNTLKDVGIVTILEAVSVAKYKLLPLNIVKITWSFFHGPSPRCCVSNGRITLSFCLLRCTFHPSKAVALI